MEALSASQQILRNELDRRKKNNPRYSLRRFAKQLNISPTMMLFLLNGQRKLTVKLAEKIVQTIPISATDRSTVLGESQGKRTERSTKIDLENIPRAFSRRMRLMDVGLLEYLETTQSRSGKSLTELAVETRLPLQLVTQAMRRLVKAGLAASAKTASRFVKAIDSQHLFAAYLHPSLQEFHLHLLERARESILNHSREVRAIESLTIALDPADLPLFRKKLRSFIEDIENSVIRGKQRSKVYSFAFTLFPLFDSQTRKDVV